MAEQAKTTIRLTDEDRAILAKLQALTGLSDMTSAIRLSIREALAARQKPKKK
jgi:hypothetical protein